LIDEHRVQTGHGNPKSHGIIEFRFPGLEWHGNQVFPWKVMETEVHMYKIFSAVVFFVNKKARRKNYYWV